MMLVKIPIESSKESAGCREAGNAVISQIPANYSNETCKNFSKFLTDSSDNLGIRANPRRRSASATNCGTYSLRVSSDKVSKPASSKVFSIKTFKK